MTGRHSHTFINHHFVNSRVGKPQPLAFSRRDFLRIGMVSLSGAALSGLLLESSHTGLAQELKGKRIYIAPDDHTDLFWTADLATYETAFVGMLDYYLDLVDKTQSEPAEFQSRWNCDGSYWVWIYERAKPGPDFERLIERIRDEHISVPLNALCVCLGGAPAEAVLRGMYYPGRLERRFGLRFNLAYSMENQTLPLGLGALWSGSGATFSWKGICGCVTQIPDAWDRQHDIYWWLGMDGSRLLMKWNSMLVGNQHIGGYAEARVPEEIVHFVDSDANFQARYPYPIIGAFGYGWDDLESQTDQFVSAAKRLSDQNLRVIVSNEIDFARDFEAAHGGDIPSLSVSFGNEWDLDCATMTEVSARIKRAVEKLRTAEGLAALVSLKKPDFMQGREEARDRAWMNLGLYWEHDWQGAPWGSLTEKRIEWTRSITGQIEDYVESLYKDAGAALGAMINQPVTNERFFVFNPLSWARTDYADYQYAGEGPVFVIDVEDGREVPSQRVGTDGHGLRILAADVPPVGYRVYEIRAGTGASFSPAAEASEGLLENEHLKVTVDPRGAITGLFDKDRAVQLAAEIDGRWMNDLGSGSGEFQVENEGPVSVTLLAASGGPLSHTTRATLFRDSDRLDIQNDITQNFDETHTWGFSFSMQDPQIHHEEVGAILLARLAGAGGHYSPRNARYDWLTLNHFVDLTQNDQYGVVISNADLFFMKTGRSTVEELDTQTPQVSILAGGMDMNGPGILARQGGDEHFMQRFGLKPHTEYDPVSAMKFALEHQNPLMAGQVTGGELYPGEAFSLLSIDNPAVLLWALKPAEEGMQAGLVARVWNLADKTADFSLSLNGGGLASILALTHIETPVHTMAPLNGRLVDTIDQQQFKTYALFPGELPYLPDTSGLSSTAVTPEVREAFTEEAQGGVNSPELQMTGTPSPGARPEGKGCLPGLLEVLAGLMK